MSDRIKLTALAPGHKGIILTISSLEEPLVVSRDSVIKHRLVANIVLTPSQIEQLRQESQLHLCDFETARLLALRPHSVGEIRAKLTRKQFEAETIKQIINNYKGKGLLDDVQYAYRQGQFLLERRPCGKAYLSAHLQRKKIERSLAESTAETLLAETDLVTLAVASLEKRWKSFSQFELETARTKSYNYLARRGFGYQAARAAFEELLNRTNKGNDD